MDNKKDNRYYVQKIVTDLAFIIKHTGTLTLAELECNEILLDSVMFRLIQIAENSEKLTTDFKTFYSDIPWRAIKGLRNRIVYGYGNVDLTVVFDTVKDDIPQLHEQLRTIME